MKNDFTQITLTILFGVLVGGADAAVLITPDGASTTATLATGPTRGPVTNLIDGIADSSNGQSIFIQTSSDTLPVTISFEFNTEQTLEGFRLWNGWNSPGNAVVDFNLNFRDSGGSSLFMFSGTGTDPAGIASAADFDDFTFTSIANVSSVDFVILTSNSANGPELREVGFLAVVPEPSSALLLVSGAIAVGMRRYRI